MSAPLGRTRYCAAGVKFEPLALEAGAFARARLGKVPPRWCAGKLARSRLSRAYYSRRATVGRLHARNLIWRTLP